jgi:hypothetical protein
VCDLIKEVKNSNGRQRSEPQSKRVARFWSSLYVHCKTCADWAARRTADAVGVANWMVVPRERNRTAHETLRVVLSTLQDMEWKARESPLDGAKWAAVTAYMQMDVRYCRQVSEVANREQIAQSAV